MRTKREAALVKIERLQETRVAALEHRGDPGRLADTIRSFIQWRKENNLPPSASSTFNIFHNDPEATAPEAFRMDLCASINGTVEKNRHGVVMKTIPGGRCAVLRHVGSDEAIRERLNYLYSEWLPQSGEALRDFPPYLQRIRFFPDVPEHEAVTDIFLPLK